MHGFPKGGNLDRKWGAPVTDPDAPIRGLQGHNLPVIRNVAEFLSGDAIFSRMLAEQASGVDLDQAEKAVGLSGPLAVRAGISLPMVGENATAA